jgi:hypothetical protein
MRILQLLSPDATEFDRKSQRIDRAALPDVYVDDRPELVHVYGPPLVPPAIRYLASSPPARRRLAWRSPRQPERLVSPLPTAGREPDSRETADQETDAQETNGRVVVPEAVEEHYFAAPVVASEGSSGRRLLGVYGPERPGVRNLVDQTRARLHRFRDDIDVRFFASTPQPEDFRPLDAWLDPAVDDRDFDGFVAEALVCDVSVVAARTPINVHRAEQGRTAILVPPGDANELTHAILAALFKPEISGPRRAAARQTLAKFRPRQRARALASLYESLAPERTTP